MTDLQERKNRMKEFHQKADLEIEELLGSEDRSPEHIHFCLKNYIQYRFLLIGDFSTDNILELSKLSIEKVLNYRKLGIEVSDVSPGCTDVSSVVAKKSLMLVQLQKALNIRLDARRMAYIDTVWGLTHEVMKQLS